jgi:hypothetical protein
LPPIREKATAMSAINRALSAETVVLRGCTEIPPDFRKGGISKISDF